MTTEYIRHISRYIDQQNSQLTGSEMKVLRAVFHSCEIQSTETVEITLKQLGEVTALSKNTLTVSIRSLESKGLLAREWRPYHPSTFTVIAPTARKRRRAA